MPLEKGGRVPTIRRRHDAWLHAGAQGFQAPRLAPYRFEADECDHVRGGAIQPGLQFALVVLRPTPAVALREPGGGAIFNLTAGFHAWAYL